MWDQHLSNSTRSSQRETKSSSLDFSKGHKKEKDDRTQKEGMSRLNLKKNIKNLKSATKGHMGRMDQLSDAYEGDGKPCP